MDADGCAAQHKYDDLAHVMMIQNLPKIATAMLMTDIGIVFGSVIREAVKRIQGQVVG